MCFGGRTEQGCLRGHPTPARERLPEDERNFWAPPPTGTVSSEDSTLNAGRTPA